MPRSARIRGLSLRCETNPQRRTASGVAAFRSLNDPGRLADTYLPLRTMRAYQYV